LATGPDSMGFWPFGGGKKNKASKQEKYRDLGYESRSTPTPDNMARNEKQARGPAERPSRINSRRPQSDQSKKLSKMPAKDTVPARATSSRDQAASPPLDPPNRARTDAYDSRAPSRQAGIYQQNVTSNSSLGPENFSSIPTLRAKRSEYNPALPRRKSSKRKAEDLAREREVRNMSSPIPIPKRPATYSEGVQARETRNMPGDLNHRFERPTSEISLPLPESFSEMETRSPASSFKVSPFAVLSPRPTIRYDANPRSEGTTRMRFHSRLSVQQAVVEEDLFSSRKRIDDLADNLDSSGLRELMERDRKRRERKREDDKTKLQRKLQRRADRQKEEEMNKAQIGDAGPSTPSRIRYRAEQDLMTSPDFPSSPPVTGDGDTEMLDSNSPASKRAEIRVDPFADPTSTAADSKKPIRNPFEDERDGDEMDDPFTHEADKDVENEPTLPVRSPLRESRNEAPSVVKTISPPSSPLQRPADTQGLTSPQAREATPDLFEGQNRSGSGQAQPVGSWTNFFRRGKRQPSVTDRPSEFTNTSRESFSRQQPPPIVPPRDIRRSTGPQRTQSKFREDLPELPISPPDSRVQSPEVESVHQAGALPMSTARKASQSFSGTSDGRSLATSASLPTLDRSKQEQHLSQQRSVDLQSTDISGPGQAVSQSLASVDSEASWLSGKPANLKRGSAQMSHPLRQSQSSLQPQIPGTFGDDEGQGVDDDEFLNRLTPAPEEGRRSSSGSAIRKASSTVIDLQGELDKSDRPEVPPLPSDLQDEKWHSSVGRQPMVVKQARAAKSKEGLLKDYENDDVYSEGDADSPDAGTPDVEYQASPLMRATSVDYGKGHSRVISAGSARLLDIRRASVQSENRSPGDRTSGVPQGSSTALQEKET
jgi:hypothetical protein